MALINSSGPDGWLDWTLAFRNMLIHRGRRIDIGQFVPRPEVILGPDGKRVPRARVVTQLPKDPDRSDIEVLREPSIPPVLTEDSETTLKGLIETTRRLTDEVGKELLAIWKWRRANPTKLVQPLRQWPKGLSTKSIGFDGYKPGAFPFKPSQFMSHPVMLRRLRSAALDDSQRVQWQEFD
jgi:hypothetical protein